MIQSVGHLIEKENARLADFQQDKQSKISEVKGMISGFIEMLKMKKSQMIMQVCS
jgi:hypothetical protein